MSKTQQNFVVFCVVVVVIVLCGLIYSSYCKHKDRTKEVFVPVTNETFVVQNNKYETDYDREQVGIRLSRLVQKADLLVDYMYKNSLPNKEVAHRLYKRWKKIRSQKEGFREVSKHEHKTAYTVNKDQQIRICVRDKVTNKLIPDENTSMFVVLHELSHVALPYLKDAHGVEFKQMFAYITKLATELGLYNYVNYSDNPVTYCATKITTPAY